MVTNKRAKTSRIANNGKGRTKPVIKKKRNVVMKREEIKRSETVAPPLPPSLAQITSLITSINKDVALLCAARPRSRDAKLLASGIARACEEIATRCRDYAGVESDEVADATRLQPAAPTPSTQTVTVAHAAWAPISRASINTTPTAPARQIVEAAAPVVVKPAPASVPHVAPTTSPIVKTPPVEKIQKETGEIEEYAGKSVNHALVLVGKEESLSEAAYRLGSGVSCSYIGRAAQVRHLNNKGFLSEGSRVILVRDNGEVIGHMPWHKTDPGHGDHAKTYFIYADPMKACAAIGTIDLEDVKFSVPVAVGPSVINRGYAESDPNLSAEFTAMRARIGAAAEAVCGLNK